MKEKFVKAEDAAKELGIARSTIYYHLKQSGVELKKYKRGKGAGIFYKLTDIKNWWENLNSFTPIEK
jgi:predicted DNA-binding transcriptional regulator AlpA